MHRHLMVPTPHYSVGSVQDQQVDGSKVQDTNLDFIFQMYMPCVQWQLMEFCALLVACSTACGSCLNAPVLVPAFSVASSCPSCASQLFL